MTNRLQFVKFLFSEIKDFKYVLLKHIDYSVLEIDESSDLDFLISRSDYSILIEKIQRFESIKKCSFKSQSTMSQLFIFFKDNSYLQLDFLFGFYRKGVEYLSKEAVFEFSKTNEEGIKICSHHHLIEHLLMFNYLNFAGIPDKYIVIFKARGS